MVPAAHSSMPNCATSSSESRFAHRTFCRITCVRIYHYDDFTIFGIKGHDPITGPLMNVCYLSFRYQFSGYLHCLFFSLDQRFSFLVVAAFGKSTSFKRGNSCLSSVCVNRNKDFSINGIKGNHPHSRALMDEIDFSIRDKL